MKNKYHILYLIFTLYLIITFFYSLQAQIVFIKEIFLKSHKVNIPDPSLAYSPKIFELFNTSNQVTTVNILRNDYQGSIIDIQKDSKTNAPYSLILRLRGSNNSENSFIFTKNQQSKINIKDQKDNSVNIDKLRFGNLIQIHEEIDLKKRWIEARTQFSIKIIK